MGRSHKASARCKTSMARRCFSLSPGERAGVRGNKRINLQAACQILGWAFKGIMFSGFLVLTAFPAEIHDPASAFQSANKLYEENKFAEAASAYQKLVESGKASSALFFNLGNALFKAGQIGRAIVAYREAEQLAPRDPDVRANLQFARNQAQGPTLPPSRWQRWLGRLTINEWTMLASGTIWAWLMLLAVLQWRPAWKQAMRGWVAGLAGAAGLFCLCLAASLYESHAEKTVIVVARDVIVRHGPLDESQTAFTAQDGAELRVLDQKDGWLEVSDGGSRLGWLRRDKVVAAPGV